MSHVNLTVFAANARFIALSVFLATDVVWWRDALMAPPTKRRALLAAAVVGPLLVLTRYGILSSSPEEHCSSHSAGFQSCSNLGKLHPVAKTH